MKYYFLGSAYDNNSEKYLLKHSKSGLQAAANQYQWGIIDGLVSILNQKITVISSYPVGAFPIRNKKFFYNGFYKKLTDLLEIKYIGFVNLYLFRDVWRIIKFESFISKKINENGFCTVFVYALDLAFVRAVKNCKKKYKEKLIIILFIPDIPGELGVMRNRYTLEGFWDMMFVKSRLNIAKYADGFVFLTEYMKDVFPIFNKPYCVVEGFLPQQINYFNNDNHFDKKIILYTGSLNMIFGIFELIEAFKLINDENYQLWICGAGDGVNFVKEQAALNNNIVYHGYVNKIRISELQQSANILINPRRNVGAYTKYSFPSKTLEYLTTGKPTIMYKLTGIPDEYDEYLFYVNGDKIEDLKHKIIEVCSLSDQTLLEFGQNARKWVLEEKNNIKQAQKVKELLTIIENKNYN